MNQQRARRFRAAKDAQMADEMEEKLRKQFENEGKVVFPKEESETSDSNIITPGTEFMHILSEKLQSYISQRMRENPAWTNIKVILSDDNVPGEGEHKIMSFIRAQRASQGYDPNTRHCLYGLDADLIMLALSTHEIHFSILREEVLPPNERLMENSMRATETHSMEEPPLQKLSCELTTVSEKLASYKAQWRVSKRQAYQFLNICILREYLALDLAIPTSDNKLEWDHLERIIDDFIFICFFAGNDFLPHLPTLEIHEGCIDLLIHVYKKEFQNPGGYLVDMQKVDDSKGAYMKLKRVERFILAVGAYEDEIFAKRSQLRERKLKRILADFSEAKDFEKIQLDEGTSSEIVGMNAIAAVAGVKLSASAVDADTVLDNTKELKQKLKDDIRNQSDLFKDGGVGTDKVKLGYPGWKERYYKEKFSAQSPDEIEATRKTVVAKFGEGLCWVLKYYFSGVPSWTWYYPFYYGPVASDLRGLTQTKVKFQKGVPFKPFDQLMGVLPPRSAHALPIGYKRLMIDENSSIIDYYPTDFQTDVDGKRYLWQGTCKLPFIEEERLLTETRKLENELKETEKIRNSQSLDRLFVRCSSKTEQQSLCCGAGAASEKIKGAITMESKIEGIKGTLHLMPEDLSKADDKKEDEYSRNILCMFFEIPQVSQLVPRLLEGVNPPEKTVNGEDIVETVLWHENHGRSSSINHHMFQNRRLIKPDSESRPQNPPPFISKGASCGFSLGRGKTSPTMSLQNPNHFPRHAAIPSSYQNYGTTGRRPSVTDSTYNRRGDFGGGSVHHRNSESNSFNVPTFRPQQPGSNFTPPHVNHGANEVQNSHCAPNYIPQQAGSNFWQPRSGVTHVRNSFYPPNYIPQQAESNFWQSHGGVTHRASEVHHSFYPSPNYRPQQSGRNFQQLRSGVATEDSRLNKPSTPVESSGERQHPHQSSSANIGHGRGRGRSRGWYSNESRSPNS